jgi:hypothetical protein
LTHIVAQEYDTTNKLVFFSLDDLRTFPKSQTVAEVAGADWFVRIVFCVSDSRVNAIEFHLKNRSDQRALIKQVTLQYSADDVSSGTETILQEPFVAPTKAYTVPQAVESGPKITDFVSYDAEIPAPGAISFSSSLHCVYSSHQIVRSVGREQVYWLLSD